DTYSHFSHETARDRDERPHVASARRLQSGPLLRECLYSCCIPSEPRGRSAVNSRYLLKVHSPCSVNEWCSQHRLLSPPDSADIKGEPPVK
ncbi:hypothetical protein BaRGS_00006913, partial [Batillaria attramentaria]